MRKRVVGLAIGLLLFGGGSAFGQVAWDSPMLMVPGGQPGLDLNLMEVAGGDLGFMGTWRSSRSPQNLGFRVGIAEEAGPDDGLAVFGGVNVSGALTRSSDEFPLDVDWVLGAGGSIGNDFWLAVPAGISVAHTFTGDGVRFTPFATPRVILDAFFGDIGDDLSLDVAVDVGLELAFRQDWAIRFGGTLGDREALAIGVVF